MDILEIYKYFKTGDILIQRGSRNIYRISKKRSSNVAVTTDDADKSIIYYKIFLRPMKINATDDWKQKYFINRCKKPYGPTHLKKYFFKVKGKRAKSLRILFG